MVKSGLLMKAKCLWCSREGIAITPKGGLAPHVDAAGKRCVGIGMRTAEPTRTPPRPFKGIVQRNRVRG